MRKKGVNRKTIRLYRYFLSLPEDELEKNLRCCSSPEELDLLYRIYKSKVYARIPKIKITKIREKNKTVEKLEQKSIKRIPSTENNLLTLEEGCILSFYPAYLFYVIVLLPHKIFETISYLLINKYLELHKGECIQVIEGLLQGEIPIGCIGVVSLYYGRQLVQREYLYLKQEDFGNVRLVCQEVGALVPITSPYLDCNPALCT